MRDGLRTSACVVLLLATVALVAQAASRKQRRAKKDEKVYLVHSDELKYDAYGLNPDAQIAKGHVHFRHNGADLTCDSAYFYQESNSMHAFGHVFFKQGDTLSLKCDRGYYDGNEQMMEARENVVLKHRKQTLYTDSLNYDRLYGNAYFFEGGQLVDGKDKLSSDWGEYNVETRQTVFYYNVRMRSGDRLITTDTLYYDNQKSMAHLVGPSRITQGKSVIDTEDGYFDTHNERAELFGRSTVVDGMKTITGDSLYYNKSTGETEGFGNVVYVDAANKNELLADYLQYNEQTGYGYATRNAVVKDYSQQDTLYAHADTMKIYSYNLNTDSVYRVVHCYPHMRAYRADVQAICDSLVASSQDSCMTMYKDPIVWNGGRQLLGEVIKVYSNDSTIREANVVGQALSVEKIGIESTADRKHEHFNQISSKQIDAYFTDGNIRRVVSHGNVRAIYYPIDDKDSSFVGLNYTETDTMKMYLSPERKLERIWMPKAQGTLYPMTQIPPTQYQLDCFAWFESLRPVSKDDIFVWRGKRDGGGSELAEQKRHAAPLQTLATPQPAQATQPADTTTQE